MATIKAKLRRILESKADIKAAIEENDVPVGNAKLSDYGDKIRQITSKATTSNKYCVGRWESWATMNPDAMRVDGDVSLALDWYPVLVDMSPVNGEVKKRPVGWLMRNNFLRFEDGSFAPTIGITAGQARQCLMQTLYLDPNQENLYCHAGEYNPETFYNEYGMTQKLYNAEGEEVRILRPWETVEKKYSIFIARKDTVYLLDHEEGADGSQLNGIIADNGKVDGVKGLHPLVPTGIAAGPCTEINGQLRCFYFDYPTGEVGCNGLAPTNDLTGTGELFFGDGTYPRVLDNDVEGDNALYPDDDGIGVNQAKNAKKARACNADPTKPYPVAEGGWHPWNTFITCLELAYGTKNLYTAARFSSGISSNDMSNNATIWLADGGVRHKLSTASAWTYTQWSTSNSTIYYDNAGHRTSMSHLLNRQAPKMFCMEAQMALSMAAELGVAPGQNFTFYGKTYSYQTPTGATPLLSGRMNARLYRTRAMTLHAFNSGKQAVTFDIECRLRAPIAEGMNLCGDHFVYMGGGLEIVTTYQHSAHRVREYIECDQTKWKGINHVVDQTADYDFMSDYEHLGEAEVTENDHVGLRTAYGVWKLEKAPSMTTGECCYTWEAALGTAANHRYRAGLRVRGSAAYAIAAARSVACNYLASLCLATDAGSAQVLLDVESEAATQSQ